MIVTNSALFFQRRPLLRLDIQIMSEYMLKQQWLKEHRNQVDCLFLTQKNISYTLQSVTSAPSREPSVYHRKQRLLVYPARIKRRNAQEIAVSSNLESTTAQPAQAINPATTTNLAREPQRLEVLAPAHILMDLERR